MTGTVLERAFARRAAIIAELAELDNFILVAKELGVGLSNKDRVLNACREILAQRTAAPLQALLNELNARGINPGTRNPAMALAVMLSRSPDFRAGRSSGGWRLACTNGESENTA